jgi:hypothetical protein
MCFRLATVLVAAGLVAAVSAPREARAADPIVAHDTLIRAIYPLDGDLVYFRAGRTLPQHVWMARFRGHLRRARGIPRRALAGDIGRDERGRKVFTFAVARRRNHSFVSTKWFAYDLAHDRTRPLHGLPATCIVTWAAVWRGSLAYTAGCKSAASSGLLVRQGKRTRRVSSDPGGQRLVFRGGTLAVVFDDGSDDFFVLQWMANGKQCVRRIDASFGDATSELGWFPSNLWSTNGYLAWTMGDPFSRPDFAILAAKVPAGCATPGPVGLLPFTPETATVLAVAVDRRRVFYAGAKTLRSHTLPAGPSFDAPPNDAFEHAQQLPGDAPLSATGRVAYATAQPGEPLADTKHTVWYAFRPTRSGTVDVTVSGACTSAHQYCYGAFRSGVYTGTSPDALTEIPPSGDYSTRVDAVAGETYWIPVGSSHLDPYYEPFVIRIDPGLPS